MNPHKVTIAGWTVALLLSAVCIYWAFDPPAPYVPPPSSSWEQEQVLVNTAQIVRLEPVVYGTRTCTRIWFGGKEGWLYAESPYYFEGPTRILTATRIK